MSSTTLSNSISDSVASTMATMVDSVATKNFNFGLTDYIVFTIMLLASSSVGIYFGFFSKSKNTTYEYLMGGKKMKTIPIAISLIASQLSAISIMSVPAESYSFGCNYIFVILSVTFVIPFLNYIIIPVFYENKFDNCYEYLQKRFNVLSRRLVTASFVLNAALSLPVHMFIPSIAFSQVTGINVHLINTVVCSICVFYTMVGGIKAVVWTDVLQAGIMLSSAVLVGVMGAAKTGGLAKVFEYADEGGRLNVNFSLDPRTRITLWNGLIGGTVMWAGSIGLNQSCVQRIVSLPSLQHARKSLKIAGVGFILVMGFNAFIGIVMYAYYYHCDPMLAGSVEKPDKMMPFFVQDIIGHLNGMPGIFISCVFSAALSTISANLNSLAGVVYFDYIKPFIKHTDAKANLTMKVFVVVMGMYSVIGGFVVQHFSSILQIIITIAGINTGAVIGIFLLGMFVPRVNGKVAVTSFILSILTMVWIIFNAQLHFRQGLMEYRPLPTRIDGCEAMNIQVIIKNLTTTPATSPITSSAGVTTAFTSDRPFSLYEVSFYWYKFIGVVIVWLTAIPLSYVWKQPEDEKQNPKLYSPFVRKLLSAPHIELEEVVPLKMTHFKLDNGHLHIVQSADNCKTKDYY